MLCISANNLKRLNNVITVTLPTISSQLIRWRRKPRCLPIAPSKIFRVPEPEIQNAAEKAELKRLHNNYKTCMRSLRLLLVEQLSRQRETPTIDHYVITPEREEQEYQRCCALNGKWNAEIAASRTERLAKKHILLVNRIQNQIQGEKVAQDKHLLKIEESIREEKELLRTSITRGNLDEAIKHTLANVVDYNFAIDINENVYEKSSAKLTHYNQIDYIISNSKINQV